MNLTSLKILLPLALLTGVAGLTLAQKSSTSDGTTIKALHVTGEGYHDYEAQKKIITEGISKRIDNIDWTIWHHKTADAAKEQMTGDWAKGYDVVVYNICHAKETDKEFIESVVAVHEAGVPAIALHCTMHSYHWDIEAAEGEVRAWNRLLGTYSRNHGPKAPIKVAIAEGKKDHPILKDLPDGWQSPEGELYNVTRVDTADVLAHGVRVMDANPNKKDLLEPQPLIWTNKSKAAVLFGTTLGHHNTTMETDVYLDLLSNGLLWVLEESKVTAEAE